MTTYLRPHRQLNYAGADLMLRAGIVKAKELGVPQNICIVDGGGNPIVFARMDGARFLAMHSARSKARTAASLGFASGHLPAQFGADLAMATGGRSINLVGGLPVVIEGDLVGAVGVSSGEDAQDLAVAQAAIDALLRVL